MGVELNNLNISAIRKTKFRTQFTKMQKEILDHVKKQQKEESKKAIDAINSYFEKNPKSAAGVIRLPVGGTSKVIPEVLKHVQNKLKDKSVYVIAADDGVENGRVQHACIVSKVRRIESTSVTRG